MIEYIHERYTLSRALTRPTKANEHHTDAQRINFILMPVDSERQVALESETRMVYVVSTETEVVYVGEAYTDLKTRMSRGFVPRRHYARTGHARGGYKGYKWIDLIEPEDANSLTVDAFMFGADFNDADYRCVIEGVEGDLVHIIRANDGKWPAYQNEIHFSNQEGAYATAEAIYETIKNFENE